MVNQIYQFLIEFKTPKGIRKLSEKQQTYLENLEKNGWKILVSNDFSECILELEKCNRYLKIKCKFCHKSYIKKSSLEKQMEKHHSEKNKFLKILDKCKYHKSSII